MPREKFLTEKSHWELMARELVRILDLKSEDEKTKQFKEADNIMFNSLVLTPEARDSFKEFVFGGGLSLEFKSEGGLKRAISEDIEEREHDFK